jgi:hypothetical protein
MRKSTVIGHGPGPSRGLELLIVPTHQSGFRAKVYDCLCHVVRDLDFEDVLGGSLFDQLREPAYFSQVAIDPITGRVTWPKWDRF